MNYLKIISNCLNCCALSLCIVICHLKLQCKDCPKLFFVFFHLTHSTLKSSVHCSLKITNLDYLNHDKFSLILIFTHITAGHTHCHTLLLWTWHAYGWKSLASRCNTKLKGSFAKTEMWGPDNDKQLVMGERRFRKKKNPTNLTNRLIHDQWWCLPFLLWDKQYSTFGTLSLIDSDKDPLCWWTMIWRQTHREKIAKRKGYSSLHTWIIAFFCVVYLQATNAWTQSINKPKSWKNETDVRKTRLIKRSKSSSEI